MGRRHKSDVASYIVPDTDPSRRTRGSGASPPEWPPRGAFHGPAAAAYGRPRHPRLTASERHRCPPQCAAHPSAAAYDCESQPAPASTRKRCPRPTAHVDERHDAHHAVDAGEHQPHPTAHDGEHHAASGHAGQRRPCPAAPACKLQSRPTAHAGEHHPASGDAGERHPWAATSACKRQPPPTAHAGEHHPAPGDAGKCRASRIDYSSTCHGCPDASPDAMGRCPCVSLPEGWFVHRPCGFFLPTVRIILSRSARPMSITKLPTQPAPLRFMAFTAHPSMPLVCPRTLRPPHGVAVGATRAHLTRRRPSGGTSVLKRVPLLAGHRPRRAGVMRPPSPVKDRVRVWP
mmetsp:Transcript_33609/g.76059  ORF Transcript_33609/g.76059 Transcript_33609/m.76059 type:complete len:346 (-) Transcript_33609:101-1138(-)